MYSRTVSAIYHIYRAVTVSRAVCFVCTGQSGKCRNACMRVSYWTDIHTLIDDRSVSQVYGLIVKLKPYNYEIMIITIVTILIITVLIIIATILSGTRSVHGFTMKCFFYFTFISRACHQIFFWKTLSRQQL